MEVVKITPRGYCHGVVNAINLIKEAVKNQELPRPIYVLGMIVHNTDIIDAFKELGVITLDSNNKTRYELLDEIESGTVIFTAHGISPTVVEKAKSKGLYVIDASCEDVIKTHNLVDKYIRDGFDVIYIGKKGHPEPEGVMFNKSNIYLVESVQDVKNLAFENLNILVTNQTTMSLHDVKEIMLAINEKYPTATFADELCNATRIRQEAVIETKNIDMLIVVGDPKSNNTKKLTEVSNVTAIRVASIDDLDPYSLMNIHRVGITSGASTPTSITNQIINYLLQFKFKDKSTWEKPKKLEPLEIINFKI